MKYLLTLDDRTILQTWDCASDEDFTAAITIYFNLAIHSGRIRRFSDGVEWMGWEVSPKEERDVPSLGEHVVWHSASGSLYVRSPFVGTLRWGPEGSWKHRTIK
jgi:hypothetical protein